MNEKVCVLLSYYRGEKYIDEQLESIIDQDYPGEIDILIRNDGPDDPGLERAKMYNGSKDRKVNVYSGENLGPQRSFLDLIRKAPDAGLYFFADQDDVWDSSKISRAAEALWEKDGPVLWCSNYAITDSSLNVLDPGGVKLTDRTFDFLYAQMYNTFPGCVMGLNRSLFQLVRKMNLTNCMMHDSFAFATAVAVGKVIYDDKSLILHRIHGSNVVGRGFHKSTPLQWIRDKFSLLVHREDYDLSEFAGRLLECGDVRAEWKEDVELLRDYRKSLGKTLKLFFHRDIRRKPDPETLSIRCKILFRLF